MPVLVHHSCCKSYLSYKFDQPEVIPDRAKMNLASHRVWRLSRNYFEPGTYVTRVFCRLLVSAVLAALDSAIHRINHYPILGRKTNNQCVIHGIDFYPVDSAILRLNNGGLLCKLTVVGLRQDLALTVREFLWFYYFFFLLKEAGGHAHCSQREIPWSWLLVGSLSNYDDDQNVNFKKQ